MHHLRVAHHCQISSAFIGRTKGERPDTAFQAQFDRRGH